MSAPITYASSSLPKVKPHLQSFADEVVPRFGPRQISTYAGHDPSSDLALDIFGTPAELHEIALWATSSEVYARFGIDYHITNLDHKGPGDIWNPEIVEAWRVMKDRGGVTQNHIDHDHFSFLAKWSVPLGEHDDMTPEQAKELLATMKQMASDIKALRDFAGPTNEFWSAKSDENVAKIVKAVGD